MDKCSRVSLIMPRENGTLTLTLCAANGDNLNLNFLESGILRNTRDNTCKPEIKCKLRHLHKNGIVM